MLHEQTNWNSSMIENLTERDAKNMALETLVIKDHNVYFVDFGGYFRYSALVFAEGRHIYYANDYELHHEYKGLTDDGKGIPYTRDELRDLYIRSMNSKLFTEDEILGPVSDYSEYYRKGHYLHNYYAMRREHVSIFHYCRTKEEENSIREKMSKMIYDPYAFAYFNVDDKDFVEHHKFLFESLQAQEDKLSDNFDYWKGAFLHEMFNHEYGINWQADFDTLSAFGNLHWEGDDAGPDKYLRQLDMNDTQKRAYYAARSEYFRTSEL